MNSAAWKSVNNSNSIKTDIGNFEKIIKKKKTEKFLMRNDTSDSKMFFPSVMSIISENIK